jgi:hypothetical protein
MTIRELLKPLLEEFSSLQKVLIKSSLLGEKLSSKGDKTSQG